MNSFLSLGRWLFAIPFALFGLLHLMNAEKMSNELVPNYMPERIIWVYLIGLMLIAVTVSMLIGRYDKLAAVLLAVFLLLVVGLVHIPATLDYSKTQATMPHLLKDLSLAGAALMYALQYARDRAVTG